VRLACDQDELEAVPRVEAAKKSTGLMKKSRPAQTALKLRDGRVCYPQRVDGRAAGNTMLTEEQLVSAIERGAHETSAQQAIVYEATPATHFEQSEHHAVLLGYYRCGTGANVDKVVQHLTALIRLRPECACLALAWVSQEKHPKLAEAGHDEYPELLWKRGLAVSPPDRTWHLAAGSYHLRRGLREADRTQLLLAHAHYAEGLALSDDEVQQNSVLGLVAYSAFKAGKFQEARQHAVEAISRSGCHGAANRHLGYIVLGLSACDDGDLAQAAQHLLASASNIPEYYLSAFGPCLELAQRLHEAGQRAPVRAFAVQLAVAWPRGAARLAAMVHGG